MGSAQRTRDHYVPQMYLRRFGRPTPSGHQLVVSTRDLTHRFQASVADVAVESGFYWGTDVNGVPHHDMETFLTAMEGDAATAFRSILDSRKEPDQDALPVWPPREDVRASLAWWIAAQILRTVRQRARLAADEARTKIKVSDRIGVANRHLAYIAELLEPLAATILSRPWGVGFSDYCLLTGDVPVLVLNGQDHGDQRAAVDYWDVYLPLDPHRCFYLPGRASIDIDRRLRRDHRFKLHAGLAMGLNSVMLDSSVRHIFFHPNHDPTPKTEPALDLGSNFPRFLMNYDILATGASVQRRWLDVHPPITNDASAERSSLSEAEVIAQATRMARELDRREDQFQNFAGH